MRKRSMAIKEAIQSTSAQHLTTLQAESAARRQADVDKRWKEREQEQRESGGAATEVSLRLCERVPLPPLPLPPLSLPPLLPSLLPPTLTHLLAPFALRLSLLFLHPSPLFLHSASPTLAQDAAERERREQLEVAEALRRIEEKQTQQGTNSQKYPLYYIYTVNVLGH